ncbi:olfactory receptor 13G1-like [Erpetoichthys calabaricus]|uniref:olfactory receptor 13G1-like n=1 Tax=Erpetoichthys calabaricus TaxID=27687 RepID=UPI00109F2AFF|nr:olfactory receptor 13G1-like [Erpetoichthys calabaricus]
MNTSFTSVTEFVLQCVIDSGQRTYTIAALVLIFLISFIGNLLVILVIVINHQHQTPMFIFIAALAVVDMINSTNLIPRMLAAMIYGSLSVSYGPCALQIHIEAHILAVETLLLCLMALDRYVAVVYPLRYPSLVTNRTALACLLQANVIAVIIITPLTILLTELIFCISNSLPSCFCDYPTMVQIACNDDPKFLTYLSTITVIFAFGPLLLILFSYIRITQAALQISSVEGKKKVFSTCLTHLLVVGTIYIPLFLSYMLPGLGIPLSIEAYNTLIIVGNTVPPMLNPIIYSFRNKEIKGSILKLLTGTKPRQEIKNY